MNIRKAEIQDLTNIVDIHIKAFPGFFLTMLGPDFLTELYRGFLLNDGGIMRVIEDADANVVGFSAGTPNPVEFFKRLRKQRGIFFLFKVIPGILRHPVIVLRKMWYAAFYKGDNSDKLTDSALLSSIAVLPEMSGMSLGKLLLSDFECCIRLYSKSVYLLTDQNGNDNVIRFYKKNDYLPESIFTHADGRVMLRLIKHF